MNRQLISIYGFIFIIASIFIGQLLYLQIFTDKYTKNAENSSIKKQIVQPQRGYIFDRNGELLVANSSYYEVVVTPKLLKEEFDTLAFCKLTSLKKEKFIERLQSAKKYSYSLASPIITYLSKEDNAKIQDKIHFFPAFSIRRMTLRRYTVSGAGNVLGYISEVNPQTLKQNEYYSRGDFIGVTGIEKAYEEELRGSKGYKYQKINRSGEVISSYKNGSEDTEVKSGSDLHLTIDYKLQEYAEKLMTGKRGGIVAIEPSSGDILTLASAPTIDPSLFVGPEKTKNLSVLLKDTVNKPLYDRAVKAQYPPGSPFKLITALAGMQMGTLVDSTTRYTCRHGFKVKGRRPIACHCGWYYRPIGVETAIAYSCNNFFSHAYAKIVDKDSATYKTGLDEWKKIMNSFGLGNFLNNDLATGSKGFIPTFEYYNQRIGERRWNKYSVVDNGIGQGEILTTPIQLANVVAAIANKGYFYTPHIVKKIDGKPVDNPNFTKAKKVAVNTEYFDPVIEGMKKVITMGTGRGIYTTKFTQAGKTGTAQNPHGQDHSIFTLFAPVEDPKIAISVFVENGHYGARWAAPIASLMAELYLTGEVTRTGIEKRMFNGNLESEYKKSWIRYLKNTGKYRELYVIPDSLRRDSIRKAKLKESLLKKKRQDSLKNTITNNSAALNESSNG